MKEHSTPATPAGVPGGRDPTARFSNTVARPEMKRDRPLSLPREWLRERRKRHFTRTKIWHLQARCVRNRNTSADVTADVTERRVQRASAGPPFMVNSPMRCRAGDQT